MADGSKPGAAMISGLQAYLSGKTIRPMTDKLTVKAPEEVTYSINLTYYINRSDSARAVAIQAAVAATKVAALTGSATVTYGGLEDD